MSQAPGFIGSSIGRKVVMAVTGVMLFGFVLVHMLGNLQVYLGPEALNHYGQFLRAAPPRSWALGRPRRAAHGRVASHLVGVVAHAGSGAPGRWSTAPVRSTYASRTMRWGGVILLPSSSTTSCT